MTTVRRRIDFNPLEPVMLSARVPCDIEVEVNYTMVNTDGSLMDVDPMLLLTLEGRTDGRHTAYSAIDFNDALGTCRMIIPEGDLSDMNGYNANLRGLMGDEPVLFAIGIFRVIERSCM